MLEGLRQSLAQPRSLGEEQISQELPGSPQAAQCQQKMQEGSGKHVCTFWKGSDRSVSTVPGCSITTAMFCLRLANSMAMHLDSWFCALLLALHVTPSISLAATACVPHMPDMDYNVQGLSAACPGVKSTGADSSLQEQSPVGVPAAQLVV